MRQFGINKRFSTLCVENGGTSTEVKADMVKERIDEIVQDLLEVRKDILLEEKQKVKEKMRI